MQDIRISSWQTLAESNYVFNDPRLDEMLFRYRARNAPESLTEPELARWNNLRQTLLFSADSGSTLIYSDYQSLMEELQNDSTVDQEVLTKLDEFVSQSVAGFVG